VDQNWNWRQALSRRSAYCYKNSMQSLHWIRCKTKERYFSTAFIDGISGASLKRDNVNKHSMPVMHGAPSRYRMREQPTFSVDTCLKTTPIVTASDLTYVLVLLINFSWLLINLKSWSKTATHFWKSIFITGAQAVSSRHPPASTGAVEWRHR